MKITNLGPIKEANIRLNKLNVFFGPNNSGKTYLSYALYGIIKHVLNNSYDLHSALTVTNNEKSMEIVVNRGNVAALFLSLVKKDLTVNFSDILTKTFCIEGTAFSESELEITENDIASLFNINVENSSVSKNRRQFVDFNQQTYAIIYNGESSTISIGKDAMVFFRDNPDVIPNTKISKKEAIILVSDFIKNNLIVNINRNIYIPAERNGANVFRDEINKQRSKVLGLLFGNEKTLKTNNNKIKYPLPISDYLVFLNDMDTSWIFPHVKLNRVVMHNYAKEYVQRVLRGKYTNDPEDGLTFHELLTKKDTARLRYKKQAIPFNVTSSSIKSLYGFSDYIRIFSSQNDLLFFDEPEMNLDPQKQVDLAELLSKMTDNNISIFLSTHSDYIFRKLTNISLKKHIDEKENSISVFNFTNGTVTQLESIWKHDYISNFDSPLANIDKEFSQLYEELPPEEQVDDGELL